MGFRAARTGGSSSDRRSGGNGYVDCRGVGVVDVFCNELPCREACLLTEIDVLSQRLPIQF